MNERLAIVRAAHLIDYVSVMRDIGAPVERDLARSRLPPSIEATPDLYVSIPLAIEWVAQCGSDVEPMHMGFLAAKQASLASLKPVHQAMIAEAQTGFKRLEALLKIAHIEDNCFRSGIKVGTDQVRVFCDIAHLGRHPFICFAEWLNLQGIISVLRSVTWPDWCPRELCFVSNHAPTQAIYAAFPGTRIRVGQPHTSILIDRAHLARATDGVTGAKDEALRPFDAEQKLPETTAEWTFASLLRLVLQPYLNDANLGLGFAADVTGLSKRTLQRRLQQTGSSYSQILQEARFDLARAMLNDPDAKIIDVAMTAGYESPQHFTRAFRRFTGVTPTSYRRQHASGIGFEADGSSAANPPNHPSPAPVD